MTAIYYRPSGFKRCIVQTLGAEINGDSATDTFTSDSAHGLAVGDTVYVTALGGGSGVALLTRYFVTAAGTTTTLKMSATRGGAALTLGTTTDMKIVPLVETRYYMANKASADAETTDLTWEGDNTKIKKTTLDGMTVGLEFDATNPGADATVFGKTAITGSLPGGITSAYGYGGGDDKQGVTCGLRLEADAVKNNAGVETSVTYTRWFPQGILTLAKPGEFGTSAKVGTTGYSFTPSRVTVDLGGDAIDGASSDGDFYFDGEI